ncbi:OmpA family protein [Dyella sp. 2HG41-7]|uniref:OmpA family protein n=1 Tax=Dyella sp. 2HG41-7 TaxID=2883239 RepID=UPI001F2640BD|nr:OmpA family protein [Dyella sp. 2HG41-7]
MHSYQRIAYVSLTALAVALSGCNGYVKKADFDSAIGQIKADQQKQQQEIDGLTQQMQQKFAQYDAKIAEMNGRIRVDTVSHFAFNDSTLRDQDKPLLDDFAKIMSKNYPQAVVTVEGFTDSAGGAGYNMKLGHKRADAVRDYLVSAGMSADQLHTVSYGKASNRQVLKGKTGDDGEPNRRVSLVVDFAGAQSQAAPTQTPAQPDQPAQPAVPNQGSQMPAAPQG